MRGWGLGIYYRTYWIHVSHIINGWFRGTRVMMTSSNGNIFRVTGPMWGKLAGHRWIPHTKTSDAELWCFLRSEPWLNGCVNNREAGDLRRHGANYDVTIMNLELLFDVWLICAKLQPIIDDLKYDQISYREMILIHNKDHGDVIIYRNASFLTFWDENPTVSIGFFLQRVINSMPWFFLYL